MKKVLQDYKQALIARHYNSNFSDETKSALSTIIDEIGELIKPKIDWVKGIEVGITSVHEKAHVINGIDQFGNEYEAIGHYSCGELEQIEDLEMIVKVG